MLRFGDGYSHDPQGFLDAAQVTIGKINDLGRVIALGVFPLRVQESRQITVQPGP